MFYHVNRNLATNRFHLKTTIKFRTKNSNDLEKLYVIHWQI